MQFYMASWGPLDNPSTYSSFPDDLYGRQVYKSELKFPYIPGTIDDPEDYFFIKYGVMDVKSLGYDVGAPLFDISTGVVLGIASDTFYNPEDPTYPIQIAAVSTGRYKKRINDMIRELTYDWPD